MKSFSFIFILVFFCACHKTHDPVPFVFETSTLPPSTSSIKAIWERVGQNENEPVLFSNAEDPLWVHAYVTSSDEAGNFYKALFVQNHFATPHRALRLMIDRTALSDYFPIGRALAIKLNGLGAGYVSGMMSVGRFDGEVLQPLSLYELQEHIVGSSQLASITGLKLSLDQLTEEDAGKWIELENVQLAKSENGKTFSGESLDTYDGLRRVLQCGNYNSILLSTSVYADFKSILLPTQSGSIRGILTKDFYGLQWVIQPNFSTDLSMQSARCDPFFEQNFEASYLGTFQEPTWTNTATAGTQLWEVYTDDASLGRSIRIGSYRSGDDQTVAWLISPPLDLSALGQPHFDFRSSVQYADKSELAVFYSTTWNGNLTHLASATWESLPVQLATAEDYPDEWVDAGAHPLPSSSSLYLAFRYTGSGKTAYDGTFELDDIRIYDPQ